MPDSLSPLPDPPAPLRLHVTSDTANVARVRRAIEAYASSAGFDGSASAEIGLVVNEVIANVIRHAYHNQPDRPIDFEAHLVADETDGGPGLLVCVRDWGNGVNPTSTPVRGYVLGQPGGLGLVCLQRMMDRVEFTPQPDGGMLLTMIKRKA